MTKTEAEVLRVKWKQQVDLPACTHSKLELESIGEAYLTGNYHCIDCGKIIAKKV
jgi:hypothetical protein